MQKLQRQGKILKIVDATGDIETRKLFKLVSTGRETLRKDLEELERLDLIRRSYGRITRGNETRIHEFLLNNRLLDKEARQSAIEEILNQKEKIRISNLAKEFGVSTATIRNDIEELKEKSNILKNHGTVQFDLDSPVRLNTLSRKFSINDGSRRIAKRILNLLKPGDTIYLNNNPICQYIASAFPLETLFSVVTDSIQIMAILADRNFNGDTIILPGVLDNSSGTIKIRDADLILSQININIAIATFSGYEANQGFYVNSFTEKENLDLIMSCAKEIMICIESSETEKAGRILFPIDPFLASIQEILVDDSGSDELYKCFSRYKLPVTYCGEDLIRIKTDRSIHKIGFLYSESNSYYAKTVRESVETAINQHKELSLIAMPVNDEVTVVVERLNYMIQEKVKYLILYISSFETGQLIAEYCHKARLKILSIDVSIPNSFFFGVNNTTAAEIGAKECTRYINDNWKGKIDSLVSIDNRKAGLSAGFRLTGIIQELQNQLDLKDQSIYHIDISTLTKLTPEESRNRLLAICGKHNVFLSFNEKTTSKLHSLVTELQNYSENILIGHNHNNRIHSLMQLPDSPLIGCIAYHPENYGDHIIQIIEDMIEEKPVELVTYSNLEWVNNPYHTARERSN